MRYVLEGTWSGYRPDQRRVVHREVVTDPDRVERLLRLQTVMFTDNTLLELSLRPARSRERVDVRITYDRLIRSAEVLGQPSTSVRELLLHVPSSGRWTWLY